MVIWGPNGMLINPRILTWVCRGILCAGDARLGHLHCKTLGPLMLALPDEPGRSVKQSKREAALGEKLVLVSAHFARGSNKATCGYGSKLSHQGTTGFGPCFHLPGFHLGYLSLTTTATLSSIFLSGPRFFGTRCLYVLPTGAVGCFDPSVRPHEMFDLCGSGRKAPGLRLARPKPHWRFLFLSGIFFVGVMGRPACFPRVLGLLLLHGHGSKSKSYFQ